MKKTFAGLIFVLLMTVCLITALPLRAEAEDGYTVFFDTGEIGRNMQPAPQTGIPLGGKLAIPTPPRASGYVFEGWYMDVDRRILFSFDSMVVRDMTLYAKWEKAAMITDEPEETVEIIEIADNSVEPTPDSGQPQEPIASPQVYPEEPQTETNIGAKTADASDAWMDCLFVAFFVILLCVIFMIIPDRRKKEGNR